MVCRRSGSAAGVPAGAGWPLRLLVTFCASPLAFSAFLSQQARRSGSDLIAEQFCKSAANDKLDSVNALDKMVVLTKCFIDA